MQIQNEKGMTLILTLLIIVVLLVFGSIFVGRSINEWNTTYREQQLAKSFHIAEGGAEAGLAKIDEMINTHMLNTITSTNPQLLGNNANQYAGSGDGLGFLTTYVKDGGTELLTVNGTEAVYTEAATNFGTGTYGYNIIITQKSNPVVVTTDSWDFPFYFRVESTGNSRGVDNKVKLVGDFTVRVQRDNFAKFALFTDHHGMPSGGIVWFTDKTNFAGPIHTNGQYSFAFNPSGVFDGEVTQHLNKARFYNSGFPFTADASSNPGVDVPVFNDIYDRGEPEIVLSSSVQKADLYDQARGGDVTIGNGIFVVNDGSKLTGGIYVRGDATIQMAVDGSNNARYSISEGTTTKIITVDIPNNQTIINTVGVGTETYAGLPNGIDDLGTIIYVDGNVTSLAGTIQEDTEITVSAENDVIISDNIRYSDYNPAVGNPGDAGYVQPNADGKTNLFGVVAWGGDIRVGTATPDNVDVHGILMARNGVFTVDNYYDQGAGPRGTAMLLGGAITQFYGAFGLFSGATGAQLAGYGRNFVYDSRTLLGRSPPYFPSMKAFVAFTNDIADKITFQKGGF